MNARIEHIRKEEREYHENYYEHYSLYEKGTWLHKPVGVVLRMANRLNTGKPLNMLDLGCGIGRNSIPLAEIAMPAGGKVVCVDLLGKALTKLRQYASKFGVKSAIVTEKSDISDYVIPPDTYDYMIACSSLEHVKSEASLHKVLKSMADGTKVGGINTIVMHTNIEEYDIATGKKRETLFEIIKSKDDVLNLLSRNYDGWERLHLQEEPLELEINRGDDPVMLKADSVTIAVIKR
ncbi:methyltransferase [Paenibacillus swuensis]|uniref:Methyltransferase n=1 Tax=Paenibacillus swuensis TaxID=1178515 RepID=A0A172TF14_9BACL|nr:class I SAM-dependent methyltransferase [Paenibacillus swuensis]ANE45631.1 methyltransferase [Paenibacillus swuensis]